MTVGPDGTLVPTSLPIVSSSELSLDGAGSDVSAEPPSLASSGASPQPKTTAIAAILAIDAKSERARIGLPISDSPIPAAIYSAFDRP